MTQQTEAVTPIILPPAPRTLGAVSGLSDLSIGGVNIVQMAGVLLIGYGSMQLYKGVKKLVRKQRSERRAFDSRKKARIMLDAQDKIAGVNSQPAGGSGYGKVIAIGLVGAMVLGGGWLAYSHFHKVAPQLPAKGAA